MSIGKKRQLNFSHVTMRATKIQGVLKGFERIKKATNSCSKKHEKVVKYKVCKQLCNMTKIVDLLKLKINFKCFTNTNLEIEFTITCAKIIHF